MGLKMDSQFCKTCVSLAAAAPKVYDHQVLISALKKEFGGSKSKAMRSMLKSGDFSGELGDELHDFLAEIIVCDASTVWTGLVAGDNGDWPILVQEYSGIFYVDAQEHDTVGYFLSKDDALLYVLSQGWDFTEESQWQ